MVLSPDDPGPGTPWIKLETDAVAVITRDYLNDPVHDTRAIWQISATDPPRSTGTATRTWPGGSGPR